MRRSNVLSLHPQLIFPAYGERKTGQMEQNTFLNINKYRNFKISFNLGTPESQEYNEYLNVACIFNGIENQWKL